MKYTISKSENVNDLVKQVNEHLQDHWEPQGTVFQFTTLAPDAKPDATGSYAGADRCHWFAQPMVSDDESTSLR